MALGKKKPQAITNISVRKKKNQKIFLSIAACLGVFSFYSFKNLEPKIENNFSYNKNLKEKEIYIPEDTNNQEQIDNPTKNIGNESPKIKTLTKNVVKTVEVKTATKDTSIVDSKSIKKINKISEVISEQYNVPEKKAKIVVKQAYELSKIHHVDPMTIIGITAVESEFNEKARNPSGAIGLMQALPKAHPEEVREIRRKGGSLYNIADNMELGTSIYSEYLKLHKGNRVKALQQYNGSLNDKSRKYSKKVFKAIHQIQLAYNN